MEITLQPMTYHFFEGQSKYVSKWWIGYDYMGQYTTHAFPTKKARKEFADNLKSQGYKESKTPIV